MPSPRCVSGFSVSSGLAFLSLAVAACGDPAAPKRVRSVQIEPIRGTFALGISAQLHAHVDADPGVDTTVRWTSVPTPAGQITPTGVLTTCYPGGIVPIAATSVADPTKSDTVWATVTVPTPGWAFPSGITRPNASTPPGPADFVDPASVNGEVEVTLSVNAAILALGCRAVQRVELRLSGPARDTTFASFEASPPFNDNRTLRARLRTTAVPNGDYLLGGSVYISGLPAPEAIVPLRLSVRN
jgi:hypothetical protein